MNKTNNIKMMMKMKKKKNNKIIQNPKWPNNNDK